MNATNLEAPGPGSKASTTCSPAGFAAAGSICSRAAPGPARPPSPPSSCSPGATPASAALYITLSETEDELRESAASHGWDARRRIEIFELVPPESLLDDDQQQSLLYSSDLELGETTKRIFEAFERVKPEPRRARQPVGDPAARAKLAALPPPDPGAEALFRRSRRDRADARRPDHRDARQDRAQRRPRRHPAGGDWRPNTAPSGGGCGSSNIAASAFAAAITISSSRPAACGSSRGWSRPSTGPSSSARPLPSDIAGARRPARRRRRARLEHAGPGPGRAPASRCSR